MNCVMCGKEIADTAKFCPYCGVKIEQQKEPAEGITEPVHEEPAEGKAENMHKEPVVNKPEDVHQASTVDKSVNMYQEQTEEVHQEKRESKSAEIPQKPTGEKVTGAPCQQVQKESGNMLQIGLFILAGVCGIMAFRVLLSMIQYFSYGSALKGLGCFLEMACCAGMAAILIMLGILKEKEKIKTLFLILSGLAIFMAVCGIIQFIGTFIGSFIRYYFSFYTFFWSLSTLLLTLVTMAAVIGITYSLLQAMGQAPDLSNILQSDSVSGYKDRTAGMNYNNQTAGTNYNNQNAGGNYNSQGGKMNYSSQNSGTNYNNQGAVPLKTNRGLLGYILLTIITCGIYGYYFIYTVARDVNVACAGDGKSTGGLLKFILLSILTCGIYSWWWEYSLGNRLAENAPRYGMSFSENGTTVLLWLIFGIFLCGIGPFIAMNIIIKNTNSICMAYNRYNGLI